MEHLIEEGSEFASNKPSVNLLTTVSQIVMDICKNPNIPLKKIYKEFVNKVRDLLIEMKVELPGSCHYKIDRLCLELLKTHVNISTRTKCIPKKEIKEMVSQMLDIDQQIDSLMARKLSLYEELSAKINEKTDIGEDKCQLPSTKESECQTEIQTNDSLTEASRKRKPDFSSVTISEAAARHGTKMLRLKEELLMCVKQENQVAESIELSQSDIKMFEPPESFSNRVAYNCEGARITCLKIMKKQCIAGSADGRIFFFSRTGGIDNVIQPHFGGITSILLWKPKIVATFNDGTVCTYDIDSGATKIMKVGSAIMASRESKGILYLATETGHIIKYNIRSLTRIGECIQVASCQIHDIEILEMQNITVVITAPDKKPVTIRNAQTGSLLMTSKFLENVMCFSSISLLPFHLGAVGVNGVTVVKFENGIEELVMNTGTQYAGNYLAVNKDVLYCSSFGGDINVLTLQGTFLKTHPGTGEYINCLSTNNKLVVFSTNSTVTAITTNEEE